MSAEQKPMAGPPGEHAGTPHAGIDVSHLPSVPFGTKSLMWWGTFGFILVEGVTLVIAAVAYLYVRLNFPQWPPPPSTHPDLLVPTINTLLMVSIIAPMQAARKAAHEYDRRRVALWLTVATAMTAIAVVLRALEFLSLDVRYDTNAYGSVVWALLILHTTLLVADLFETGCFAVMFLIGHAQRKHYSDIGDAALYQFFLSTVAVPVYVLIFWGPRIL
jgi:cytochrome c oxidase subunit III